MVDIYFLEDGICVPASFFNELAETDDVEVSWNLGASYILGEGVVVCGDDGAVAKLVLRVA